MNNYTINTIHFQILIIQENMVHSNFSVSGWVFTLLGRFQVGSFAFLVQVFGTGFWKTNISLLVLCQQEYSDSLIFSNKIKINNVHLKVFNNT